ncbi:MAG: thioredoxin family protein [Truepera sp.]|nr:thioredoxin family protein [Truepera sp.]
MNAKRKVEVFTAGCPVCDETVRLVRRIACELCDVTILNLSAPDVAQRAKDLGIRSVPAVVVNGQLASCCTGRGPNEHDLLSAGVPAA